jgi:hypothetical protein
MADRRSGAGGAATQFAPAERAPAGEVQERFKRLSAAPLLRGLVDAVPSLFLVLNRHRQIVFVNRAALDFLGLRDAGDALGLRPGEAVGCVHSDETEGGCGTTYFCGECGAVNAILAGIGGNADVRECRITRSGGREPLDLRVWATPFPYQGESFTIFVAVDIGHEKRRRALERLFFHDVLNTAEGLVTLSSLLKDATAEEYRGFVPLLPQMVRKLVEEILAQRDLAAAENHELRVHPRPVDTRAFLEGLVAQYRNHPSAADRDLRVSPDAAAVTFRTDPLILGRVVGNMILNALEAAPAGQVVTVGCEADDNEVRLRVHNLGCMSESVQRQVFQRSFTTKELGRGLGTYSMKLLSERYLNGNVSFTTSPKQGTTFTARYPRGL